MSRVCYKFNIERNSIFLIIWNIYIQGEDRSLDTDLTEFSISYILAQIMYLC